MNPRALTYPLIVSAVLHAAVMSGILTAGAGTISGLGIGASVVFISIESQGNAGGSETLETLAKSRASGTPGGHRGTARTRERPEPTHARQDPALQPDQDSTQRKPANESATVRETGHEEANGEETGYRGLWVQGDGGENGDSFDAYALLKDPYGNLNGVGTGNGAGNGVAGTSSSAAIADLPKPSYPIYSRIRGEEGTVMLEAEVTADGKPARTMVIRSSGYRHLDDAALDALKKASFIPASILGMPVASTKRISIRFNIRE